MTKSAPDEQRSPPRQLPGADPQSKLLRSSTNQCFHESSTSCLLGLSGKAEDSSVRLAPRKPSAWSSPAIRSRLFCVQYTRPLRCYQGTRCGLFDEMSDGLRLRHIHGVAAFDLDDR